MSITRTLLFQASGLERNVNLMLCFRPLNQHNAFVKEFPVAWKVIKLPQRANYRSVIEFTSDSAFFSPDIGRDNSVAADGVQRCQPGQQCQIKTENGRDCLSPAQNVDGNPKNLVKCANQTQKPANIGFGFFDSQDELKNAFVWKGVPVGETVDVDVAPLSLQIYATNDYQETQIINEEVEYPLVWSADVFSLGPAVHLNVSMNAGRVIISKV